DGEGRRVAALPGGGEALLDCGALSLTHPVGEWLEAKATTLLQHRRVVRDHEPPICQQVGDRAKDVPRRGQGETGALRLAEDRLEAVFRPRGRLHRNDDRELHAAAGCRKRSRAAAAT